MVNKKIILSVLIIGCIATVAGAGTWAYFDDTKVSENNKITTGTIELSPGDNALTSFTIGSGGSDKPLVPGDKGTAKTVTLKNSGNVKGYLYAEITTTNEADVPSLETTIGKNDDPKKMTNNAKIYLGELPADSSVQTYLIKYEFKETNQNQEKEKNKAVTYTIKYHLQQLKDSKDSDNKNQ